MAMKLGSMHELLVTELKDLYNAEGQLVKALPKIAKKASSEALREALTDLDDRQAQVFCLVCLEGLSYQQVAEQVGVTVNHVGVLLNRAKTRLRERLQAHGPAPATKSLGKGGQP